MVKGSVRGKESLETVLLLGRVTGSDQALDNASDLVHRVLHL